MKSEEVAFLRHYLRMHPELEQLVKVTPPAVRCGTRWRLFKRFRALPIGVEFEIGPGKKVRVFPEAETVTSRERFRDVFLNFLKRHFPRWEVLRSLTGTDRNRHQSAALLRLHVRSGFHHLALIIAYPEEINHRPERILSSAVLWWDQLQGTERIDEIAVFVPQGRDNRDLVAGFGRVNLPITCFEYRIGLKRNGWDVVDSSWKKIYPSLNRFSQVKDPYVIFPYQEELPLILDQIRRRHTVLEASFRHGSWELSYLGLRIAWWEPNDDGCFFDVLSPCRLTSATSSAFERHLQEVMQMRRFPPGDAGHPYYRLSQERWLESVLLRNYSAISSDFTGRFYSQVPTYLDGQRKVLDLLTATRQGNLAVLELKVESDFDVVFQALDYWERVWHHLQEGDFRKAGYFSRIELAQEPPLLYVVCPLFEFHKVLPVLARYLRGNIVWNCVGINSNWRRKLKVLRKFSF